MQESKEEAREVWEYEIDELVRKTAQTAGEDDNVVKAEKAAIIECLIRRYEQRFGVGYPNTLNRL